MEATLQLPSTPIMDLGLTSIEALVRGLRRPLVRPEERAYVKLLDYATATLGPPVVAARSLADLDERLERLVDDEEFRQLQPLLVRAAERLAVASEDVDVDALSKDLARDVGVGLEGGLRECFRLMRAREAIGAQLATADTPELEGLSPYDFLEDLTIPRRLRRVMMAALEIDLCVFGIFHVAFGEAPQAEPWLRRALVDALALRLRLVLALLVALPGVIVPAGLEDIEPLDLAAIDAEMDRLRAGFERLGRQAEQSGQDVFAPLGEPIFDD